MTKNNQFARIKILKMKDKLRESIIALVYIVSTQFCKEGIPVTKTTIHKLAFFARKEGLFPYFNPGILKHGTWSLDIERPINELIEDGVFKVETQLEKIYKTMPGLERQMNLVKINPEKVNIEYLEDIISRSQYRDRIRGLTRRLGSDITHIGNESKKEFIEYLIDEDKYPYVYASPKWIRQKFREVKEKPTPPPLRKLSELNRHMGKLIYDIIENKEFQKSYVFLITSIKKAFENHAWLEAKGSPYLQFGPLLNVIDETADELHLYFTNETYYPWNGIRVILDKNDIFENDLKRLINKRCLLYGVIDEYSREPVIKVAALIYVEDIPADFPKFYDEGN